ncbi:MAG: helix-turn-helix transcriptional regulator [Clostridia bacterium]|nr:helix-turn-helix transcriptional regulator [Clostridia bacterium]
MKNTINTKPILSFMKENHLNKAAFCRLCGISVYSLNKILTNPKGLRVTPIVKIVNLLNIKLSDLLNT